MIINLFRICIRLMKLKYREDEIRNLHWRACTVCYVYFMNLEWWIYRPNCVALQGSILDERHPFSNDFLLSVAVFGPLQHFSSVFYFNCLLQLFTKWYLFPNSLSRTSLHKTLSISELKTKQPSANFINFTYF